MLGTRLILAASQVLRLGVACAFIVAGTLKLADPAAFAEQTANYQFLPEYSNFVASTLPSIEILASIALLTLRGAFRWAGAAVIAGLLAVFTTALIRAWALGINLECGCFGIGSTEIGIWPVLRNTALMTALDLSYYLELRGAQSVFATPATAG